MIAFQALADATRRRIVELLARNELSAGEIAGRFEVSAAAISQHLKLLKEARLVKMRVEAQKRIYALDPEGLYALDGWLANIRRLSDRADG